MRKIIFLFISILLIAYCSGSIENENNPFPKHMKKKYYGIDNINTEEYDSIKVKIGGVNLLIVTIDCNDFAEIEKAIEKAEKNNFQLIIWPGGYGHQWTPWRFNNGDWDISEGQAFLEYVENYIQSGGKAVNSILMSHEPFWNHGNPFSSQDMKNLYAKLKNKAPNTKLFVYIGNLAKNEAYYDNVAIEEGIADIVGIWWHNFGGAEGGPTDKMVIKMIEDDIGLIEDRDINMEILFAIQCFEWDGHDYQMPSAEELKLFSQKILHVSGLNGIIWYSWDDYKTYTKCLKKNRLDNENNDLWEVIKFQNSNHYD